MSDKYFPMICNSCGWIGMSDQADGGNHEVDCDELRCPVCGEIHDSCGVFCVCRWDEPEYIAKIQSLRDTIGTLKNVRAKNHDGFQQESGTTEGMTDDEIHALIMSGKWWINDNGIWVKVTPRIYSGEYRDYNTNYQALDWFRNRRFAKTPQRK